MLYIISKIVNIALQPLLVFFFLAGLAWVFKKKRKQLLIGAFVFLYVFSIDAVFSPVAQLYEQPTKMQRSLYTYGIVPGGMASVDIETNDVRFAAPAARLFQAVRLYKQGTISKIFISGGSQGANKEAIFLKNYLLQIGIPAHDVRIEYASLNTRENAYFTAKALKPAKNRHTYLLISSAYHLPRACRAFRSRGFACDAYASDFLHNKGISMYSFVPQSDILTKWNYLLHEMVGSVAYRLFFSAKAKTWGC